MTVWMVESGSVFALSGKEKEKNQWLTSDRVVNSG